MQIIFRCQKFSLRVLLCICLISYQFQPGIAHKSVPYIKKRVVKRIAEKLPPFYGLATIPPYKSNFLFLI